MNWVGAWATTLSVDSTVEKLTPSILMVFGRSPLGPQIVVEVKTSDAYRINLDTVANYRECLIRETRISDISSILLVVGRQDTGDLEAQIRGSKHAWDTRVISAESLINLVKIKESADEDTTITKIRSLLTPFEYTRLDNIIDIMFTATRDVEISLNRILKLANPTFSFPTLRCLFNSTLRSGQWICCASELFRHSLNETELV